MQRVYVINGSQNMNQRQLRFKRIEIINKFISLKGNDTFSIMNSNIAYPADYSFQSFIEHLSIMCDADIIFVLDDWEENPYSIIQHDVAKLYGFYIVYEGELE